MHCGILYAVLYCNSLDNVVVYLGIHTNIANYAHNAEIARVVLQYALTNRACVDQVHYVTFGQNP